jgi:recombinational DNA repair ATPase RecF
MSELDRERRERLVARLADGGQSVITTTDLAHVPTSDRPGVARLAVGDGAVLSHAHAA